MSTEKIECGGCAPPVQVTTPNDAARPIYLVYAGEYEWDGPYEGPLDLYYVKHNGPIPDACNHLYYPATDYDKLREEVERLREWRFKLCESLGFDCGADWTAEEVASAQIKHLTTAAENTAHFMRRAEAAEVKISEVRDALRELVALVRGECPQLLSEDSGGDAELSIRIDAALNAQDPQ